MALAPKVLVHAVPAHAIKKMHMLKKKHYTRVSACCLAALLFAVAGCQGGPRPLLNSPVTPAWPTGNQTGAVSAPASQINSVGTNAGSASAGQSPNQSQAIAPRQENRPGGLSDDTPNQSSFAIPQSTSNNNVYRSSVMRAQSPQEPGTIRQTAFQTPETQSQALPGTVGAPSTIQFPSIQTGNPGEPNPLVRPFAPGGLAPFPQNYADLDIVLSETQTGRINFGGAYNSDNGIVGQFVIDERNFDILAFPRSFQEIIDGTAFRGNGQTFRLELVPGDEVQRYLVSFGEPYLFNTAVSFNFSAYLFDRRYFDWDEQRLGGRIALGYRLTPDLSVSAGLRMENVEISDPRVGTSPQLNAALGDTDLFIGHVGLIRDTRDHPFMATEGSYLSMTFSQGFGEFDFSRGDIDFRRYRLLYQRPDGSGRHTLSFGTRVGFSGSQTPIFENYFAGGFSSLRGFDFRGASPTEGGVRVGGEFQWLNTLEYTFPLTADDMIKGVLFVDFGTVEENVTISSDNFRLAPGFGTRIHMPAAGLGAPLAFDFAFPIASAFGDDEQVFSFYLGVLR